MIRKVLIVVAVMFGVFALAPAAGAQYQPGQPAVVLTPSTTPPGGLVTALGFGCAPNQRVEITVGGVLTAVTISKDDGQGSFEVTFTAPNDPGQYTVVVTCGVIIISTILTVITPVVTPVDNATLPQTGSSDSLPLARAGLVLIAAGGLLVLSVRRRRET